MSYYLVKFNDNYADEFDMDGFTTMVADSPKDVKDSLVSGVKFPYEDYFGSNEEMQWDTKEDFLACLEIKKISKEEYNTLDKLFGGSFGYFPELESNDDWEDEEDDD